jgi:hypothetical protein
LPPWLGSELGEFYSNQTLYQFELGPGVEELQLSLGAIVGIPPRIQTVAAKNPGCQQTVLQFCCAELVLEACSGVLKTAMLFFH